MSVLVLILVGFAVAVAVYVVCFLIVVVGIRWAIRDSELPERFWGDAE